MRVFIEDFVDAVSGDRPYVYVKDKAVPLTTYGIKVMKEPAQADVVTKLMPTVVSKFGFQGIGKKENHPDFSGAFERPAITAMLSYRQVSDNDWCEVVQAGIDAGHKFDGELGAGTFLNFIVKHGRVNTAALMLDNAEQLGITETSKELGVNDATIAAAVRNVPNSCDAKESFENGVIALLKSYNYDLDARVLSPSSPFTLERAIESSECNRVSSFLQHQLTKEIAQKADIHSDKVAVPESLNIRGRGFD